MLLTASLVLCSSTDVVGIATLQLVPGLRWTPTRPGSPCLWSHCRPRAGERTSADVPNYWISSTVGGTGHTPLVCCPFGEIYPRRAAVGVRKRTRSTGGHAAGHQGWWPVEQ